MTAERIDAESQVGDGPTGSLFSLSDSVASFKTTELVLSYSGLFFINSIMKYATWREMDDEGILSTYSLAGPGQSLPLPKSILPLKLVGREERGSFQALLWQ